MNFTKMQSTGNDFILVQSSDQECDWSKMAISMCDRHFGIGADGLLIVVDLSNTPLEQVDAVTTQLEVMRIDIGVRIRTEREQDIILNRQDAIFIGNKLDLPNASENFMALHNKYEGQLAITAISAKENIGLEELKLKIYQMLQIIRVYTKIPGQKPDFSDPIILDEGSTLGHAAESVHKDFAAKLKYARMWGSGKYDGVMVKRDHILQDGDIIELHM